MLDRAPRAAALAALASIAAWPLLRLCWLSFSGEGADLTLAGWRETLSLQALPRAAANTLLVAADAAGLATTLGGAAAFLVARGDLPAAGAVWRKPATAAAWRSWPEE